MVLRQEIYGLDGSDLERHPYSTAEHNCQIRMIQPLIAQAHAVFAVVESEAVTCQYERNPGDPRISHNLNTVIDRYGNILEAVSVVYPRKIPDLSLPAEIRAEQGKLNIMYTENCLTSIIDEPSCYRLPLPCENKVWELGGKQPAAEYFTLTELKTAFAEALIRPYHQALEGTAVQKRLIEHSRTLYLKDDLSGALPFPEAGMLGLTYESYHLAFTQDILDNIYAGRVDQSVLAEGKYKLSQELRNAGLFPPSEPDDQWWVPSGIAGYPAEAEQHFYLPEKYIDQWGSETKIKYYADYHLLIAETEDMTGSVTRVDNFDFRILTPLAVRDLNDNITEVKLDLLGFVVGIANKGKGEEADDFEGFNCELSPAEIAAFFDDPAASGPGLLQHAGIRFVYDLSKLPVSIGSITRETPYREAINQGTESKLQYKFEYCDGLGNTLMKKIQAEPGKARKLDAGGDVIEVDTSPALRWVGNGRKVLNNKGNPVKHYEPYFSVTNQYESSRELVEIGVTPLMHYDAAGRLLRTDNPEGTFSKSEFDAWLTKNYDANDTVKDSQWYTDRMSGPLAADPPEHEAAVKSALHYDTPSVVYLDSLGRNISTRVQNRYRDRHTGDIVNETQLTFTRLDIEGNRFFIRDARNNKVVEYKYSLDGKAGYMKNMDAGESWIISDVTGKPIYKWNSRDTMIHFKYDLLHRLLEIEVTEKDKPKIIVNKTVYGETVADAKTKNLRGLAVTVYDNAGIVVNEAYDYKGNLLSGYRQLCTEYRQTPDWSDPAAVLLEPEQYRTRTEYDALNRPVRINLPDQSTVRHLYNEAALLNQVKAGIKGGPEDFLVKDIDYNERGQRLKITYGNDLETSLQYDPLTFRLKNMASSRNFDPKTLQNLTYTYDPAGNILKIADQAQQVIYYDGAVVTPENGFTYDALYRLIEASGREHEGQNRPFNEYDTCRKLASHPNDGTKMRRYADYYSYDGVGNITEIAHRVMSDSTLNWTRTLNYRPDNNHLISTVTGSELPSAYAYNPGGSMAAMPHLSSLEWDYEERLQAINRDPGNSDGDFNKAWYVYDASGQRVRKVVSFPGNLLKERLYLGGVEIYREKYSGNTRLERETLHIMDDQRRIALVDTKTRENGGNLPNPSSLIRYQLDNHLGTACVEADREGSIISYEEYYPFGCTSYQATRSSGVEVPEKTYRYTGKERDSESGLYYHGARYYIPWLARWNQADPAGVNAGLNQYAYVNNNPVILHDPNGLDDVCGVWDLEEQVCRQEACGISIFR